MIIDLSPAQKVEIKKLSDEHLRSVVVYATPDNRLHVRWLSDPPVQFGIRIHEHLRKNNQ
jgi:hypothetical protein